MSHAGIPADDDPFAFLDALPDDLESAGTATAAAPLAPAKPAGHVENCPKCRGSGRFRSWAGRDVGPCLKCKGKGTLTFAQDATTRAMNREKAAATKARKSGAAQAAWAESNPEAWAWIQANPGFAFAVAMAEAVGKVRRANR